MKKAHEWLSTKNPNLGGMTPDEMIAKGKGQMVLNFIKLCLDENFQ